jgi:hypothetical protein
MHLAKYPTPSAFSASSRFFSATWCGDGCGGAFAPTA